MSTPVRVERQRREADCGVACFAMVLGIPYEEAAEALITTNGPVAKGLYMTQLQRAADAVKKPLRRLRRWDVEDAVGILRVENEARTHFVVLLDGHIIDPADATVWNYDDYLKTNNFVASKTLLSPSPSEN
jgi:hypothetical protein